MKNDFIKKVHLLLLIIGAAVPLNYFVQFIVEYGFDLRMVFDQIHSSNILKFVASSVLLSSVTFLYFMYIESKKHKIYTWWICVIAIFTVGLSLALPLFLYIRGDYIDIEKLNDGKVKL
ncbi:MAG: DUF2834 domain-containing protein [Acidaminobacteraceae bacterium]